jgi:hypothetical protein
MKKQLYYVLYFEMDDIDGCMESNGNKNITIYEIEDNKPKEFCTIYTTTDTDSLKTIKEYFDDERSEEFDDFEFTML